jgi:hypothetical protein
VSRRTRAARLTATALPAVLLAVPLAAPAQAAVYGAPEAVCARALVAATASGAVWGACSLAGGVAVTSRRPGQAWAQTAVLWRGWRALAVADDGATTFVVLGQDLPYPGTRVAVAKVAHGGRPSAVTELDRTEQFGEAASIVARAGQWWAVWTSTIRDLDVPGSGGVSVAYRKTVGGAGRGTVLFTHDAAVSPSIALTGAGAVVGYALHPRSASPATLQLARAGADGRFTSTPFAPAAGAAAASPAVVSSGGRTLVAWSRDGRPALADATSAGARQDLPARGPVTDLQLAASGGHAYVVTRQAFSYTGARTARVYAADVTTAGVSTTELTAAAARRAPHLVATLSGTTAARGRATVVVDAQAFASR